MSTVPKQTYSVSEIREEILWLSEDFDQNNIEHEDPVMVVDQDKPIMAILPFEEYDSLLETLEIVNDDELMAHLCRAIVETDEGKGIPWEEVKKELHR